MKLQTKLILPFIIFFCGLLVVSILFFSFADLTKRNYQRIAESDTRFQDEANMLVYYGLIRDVSLANYQTTGADVYLENYDKYLLKSSELYAELIEGLEHPELKQLYSEQFDAFKKVTAYEQKVIDGSLPSGSLSGDEYLALKSDLSAKTDLPKEYYAVHVQPDLVKNIEDVNTNSWILAVVILITVLLIYLEYRIVRRDVLSPLDQLAYGLKNLSSRSFDIRLKGESHSETGRLIAELNRAAQELKSVSSAKGGKGSDNERKLIDKVKSLTAEVDNLKNMTQLAMVMLKEKEKDKK